MQPIIGFVAEASSVPRKERSIAGYCNGSRGTEMEEPKQERNLGLDRRVLDGVIEFFLDPNTGPNASAAVGNSTRERIPVRGPELAAGEHQIQVHGAELDHRHVTHALNLKR